jgi:hypothetical protein
MSGLMGVRPIAVLAGLCVGALVVLELLTSQGVTAVIVPPPDSAGEELVRAMHARRFTAAQRELAEGLRVQMGEAGVRGLADALEAAGRGLEDAHGQGYERQNERATAHLLVKTKDGQERPIDLPLTKEQGEWKVASLEPLRALVPQARP